MRENIYSDLVTENGVFRYKTSEKEIIFTHLLSSIVVWWRQENPETDFNNNDLGSIKIHKLLFFIVAASCNDKNEGLLKHFSFSAGPYGHIDYGIHQLIEYRKGVFGKYRITKQKTFIK